MPANLYSESEAELQQVKIFNNSKVGNLTTIDSNNESQVKVLSIELFEEEKSPQIAPYT